MFKLGKNMQKWPYTRGKTERDLCKALIYEHNKFKQQQTELVATVHKWKNCIETGSYFESFRYLHTT